MKPPDLIGLILPMILVIGFIEAGQSGSVLLIVPMGVAMVASVGYTLYQYWRTEQHRKARR